MPGPVNHHKIADDPTPQVDVFHQPATDNSGNDYYELVTDYSEPGQEVTSIPIGRLGMLPLLAVVLEELSLTSKAGEPTGNAKLAVKNAILFLQVGQRDKISKFRAAQVLAPPMSDDAEIENLVMIPEGLKPIDEMTETQIVNELADLGLTRMGTKQLDTSHWGKNQLQTILMTAREKEYGRG